MQHKEKVRAAVRKNYSKVARGGANGACCGGSCGCGNGNMDISAATLGLGYTAADLADAPDGANMGLGCGNPLAIASLKEGEVVLDLGSGGGFDCFLARKQVGESGFVIGVDMTPDMVQLARKNAENSGYSNIDFRLGEIEHLPVADASVDVILSNCVINLSVDKQQVFSEAYRVLKPHGRLSISDVAATAPLTETIRKDLALYSGCIGGAASVEEIKAMLHNAGFAKVKLTPKKSGREIIKSWGFGAGLEDVVCPYIIEAVKE